MCEYFKSTYIKFLTLVNQK